MSAVRDAMTRISTVLHEFKAQAEVYKRRYRLALSDGGDILQTAYLDAHLCCDVSPGLAEFILGLPTARLRALILKGLEHAARMLQAAELQAPCAPHVGLPSPWELADAQRTIACVKGTISRDARFALDVFLCGEDPQLVAGRYAIPDDEAIGRFESGLGELNAAVLEQLQDEFGPSAVEEFQRRVRLYGEFLRKRL